jgi:hypothetical protein
VRLVFCKQSAAKSLVKSRNCVTEGGRYNTPFLSGVQQQMYKSQAGYKTGDVKAQRGRVLVTRKTFKASEQKEHLFYS